MWGGEGRRRHLPKGRTFKKFGKIFLDNPTDRQTVRPTDRQTDGQTDIVVHREVTLPKIVLT